MSAPAAFWIGKLAPYKARNGEVWRVVYLDCDDVEYPVVALDSKGIPNTFTRGGRLLNAEETEFDIIGSAVVEPAPAPVPSRLSGWVGCHTRLFGGSAQAFGRVCETCEEAIGTFVDDFGFLPDTVFDISKCVPAIASAKRGK